MPVCWDWTGTAKCASWSDNATDSGGLETTGPGGLHRCGLEIVECGLPVPMKLNQCGKVGFEEDPKAVVRMCREEFVLVKRQSSKKH